MLGEAAFADPRQEEKMGGDYGSVRSVVWPQPSDFGSYRQISDNQFSRPKKYFCLSDALHSVHDPWLL